MSTALASTFRNKVILVTGGTGSIGSELVTQLLTYKPKQVRILSRDESKQYYLLEHLNNHESLRFLIGDVRDKDRLQRAFINVDIVFHAAALKHVPLCEYNPFEAVKTNIMGSQNVVEVALDHNVDRVIAISTDKAANPSNVMGISKLMMERLVINANYYRGSARTKFACVRFGNVAWARGSVLPLWKQQARRSKAIRVTNHNMTRFFMSLNQAVHLVLKTAQATQGGEIFILKMPSIKIRDLARLFLKKYFPDERIKIEYIGDRPGEKQHEELYAPTVKPKVVYENEEMIALIPAMDIPDLRQKDRAYPGFRESKKLRNASSEHFINIRKIQAII